MFEGRTVSTGRKPTETELKLAEVLGMKQGGLYQSFPTPGGTLFTQPPYFSTSPQWIPVLKKDAAKRGLTLVDSNDPEEVANDYLNKLTSL